MIIHIIDILSGNKIGNYIQPDNDVETATDFISKRMDIEIIQVCDVYEIEESDAVHFNKKKTEIEKAFTSVLVILVRQHSIFGKYV